MALDAIQRLARDIVTNRVYFAIESSDVEASFGGVLAMSGFAMTKGFIETVGGLWEYNRKAGPVAVNGRSMFLSVHFIHKEDVPILLAEMRPLVEAMKLREPIDNLPSSDDT